MKLYIAAAKSCRDCGDDLRLFISENKPTEQELFELKKPLGYCATEYKMVETYIYCLGGSIVELEKE